MVGEIYQGELFMHMSDEKYFAKVEESYDFYSVHYWPTDLQAINIFKLFIARNITRLLFLHPTR